MSTAVDNEAPVPVPVPIIQGKVYTWKNRTLVRVYSVSDRESGPPPRARSRIPWERSRVQPSSSSVLEIPDADRLSCVVTPIKT